MTIDRLQPRRFELKYVIQPPLALAIRDFVSSYLSLDDYGATQSDYSYPVHSLYLDSPDLALYQSTINGDKNRFKMRLRFYEDRPGAPVYFEIKRRHDNVISKQRAAVWRESVDRLLAGHGAQPSDLAAPENPQHLGALEEFTRQLNRLAARPQAHVAYRREAWLEKRDNSVRVTIDRSVRSCPERTARLDPEMRDPVFVFGNNVVLELKFTETFPAWMRELVRVFELRQGAAAKYVDGVVVMKEETLLEAQPSDWPSDGVERSRESRARKRKMSRTGTEFIPEVS